jgi:hypothetical protein
MELLDRNVPPGTAVNLVDGDRSDAALVASDAAACALVLMTADGACKKLHREETIQVLNNWGQFYPPKPTERASSL